MSEMQSTVTHENSWLLPQQNLWLQTIAQWLFDANIEIDTTDSNKTPELRTWRTLDQQMDDVSKRAEYLHEVLIARRWLTNPTQYHYDIVRMAGLEPDSFFTRAQLLLKQKQEKENGILYHPTNGEILLRYSGDTKSTSCA